MAVGLLVLVYRQARPARHRRIAAWCAAILTAAAGGWSRVYLVSEGGPRDLVWLAETAQRRRPQHGSSRT
jgi:hypothetical protein